MKFEAQPVPNFSPTSADFRMRELDSQIRKAKSRLEAMKLRKKVLCAKLSLIRRALDAKKKIEKSDDDLSDVLGPFISMQLGPSVQDDLDMKLLDLNLNETKTGLPLVESN